MTKESFTRALRAFARRQPFRPFLVEFLTGERLLIKHPEELAPHPKRQLIVYRDKHYRYRLFESGAIVQLLDQPGDESN
jgi:hypothetical protein